MSLISDGSSLKSENSNGTEPGQSLITEEMRKEEEELHRKTMREEAEQKRKAMEVRLLNNKGNLCRIVLHKEGCLTGQLGISEVRRSVCTL